MSVGRKTSAAVGNEVTKHLRMIINITESPSVDPCANKHKIIYYYETMFA